MREIKFRVWNKETKIMWSEFNIGIGGKSETKSFNIMQFTGLKDKNGKEIYEGDIIKVNEINWLVEPINSLEKDGCNYGLCVSPEGNGENYFLDESIYKGEVIGNIYENPELLKEK